MFERNRVRNVVIASVVLLGATACSEGSGDTIGECDFGYSEAGHEITSEERDGVESAIQSIGPGEWFTLEDLQTYARETDTGAEDQGANILGFGRIDKADRVGELACYQGNILYLSRAGEDVLSHYNEHRSEELNCESLQNNPAYRDLTIDC